MTYGDVAKLAQTSPRVVGNALHANPDPTTIPCHRVVSSEGKLSGSFAFGGATGQRERLKQENVPFVHETVDLVRCRKSVRV